jgi:PilZ domain
MLLVEFRRKGGRGRTVRFRVDLPIRVFGVDADEHAFSQIARALNISDHGTKLSGLEKHLKSGDITGVHFGDKKACCNVIWIVDAPEVPKVAVGVKVAEGQPCPWQTEMETERAIGTAPISRTAPTSEDKRKFPRQRIFFQIEIRHGQGDDAAMRTRTADIAGSGCYIETMLPFPVGQILIITFWLDSERVQTTAIVRTCDGGVGMGIEFTGLDEATQKRLQQQAETSAADSAEMISGSEVTDA